MRTFIFFLLISCLSSTSGSGPDAEAAALEATERSAGPRSFGIEDVEGFAESARLALLGRSEALAKAVTCYQRGDRETAAILRGGEFNETTQTSALAAAVNLRRAAGEMNAVVRDCHVIDSLSDAERPARAARNFADLMARRVQDLALRWARVRAANGYIPSTHPALQAYQDLLDDVLYNDQLLPVQASRDCLVAALRYYWTFMTEEDQGRTPFELLGGSYDVVPLIGVLEPAQAIEVCAFQLNALRTPLSRFLEADAGFADFLWGARDLPPHVDSFCIPGVNEHGAATPPLVLLPEVCMVSLARWGWAEQVRLHNLAVRENLDSRNHLRPDVYTRNPHMRAWGDLMGAWFTKPRLRVLSAAGIDLSGALKAAVKRKPGASTTTAARLLLKGLLLPDAPPEPASRATGGASRGKRKGKGGKSRGAASRAVSEPVAPTLGDEVTPRPARAGAGGDGGVSAAAVGASPRVEEAPAEPAFDWNAHFERLNAGLSRARKAERAAMRAETLPVTRFGGDGEEAAEGGASAPARALPFQRAPLSAMPARVQKFVVAMQEPQCVVDGRILWAAVKGFASFFKPDSPYGYFEVEEAEGSRVTLRHPNFGVIHLHMPHAPQVVSRDAGSERSPWWTIIRALVELSEE